MFQKCGTRWKDKAHGASFRPDADLYYSMKIHSVLGWEITITTIARLLFSGTIGRTSCLCAVMDQYTHGKNCYFISTLVGSAKSSKETGYKEMYSTGPEEPSPEVLFRSVC